VPRGHTIDKTYEAKIGLMYLSEYYYGAMPTHWTKPGYNSGATKDYRTAVNDNWIYMGVNEWTISPSTDLIKYSFCEDGIGHACIHGINNYAMLRPTFYLISNVELAGGSGSKENPFRIKI